MNKYLVYLKTEKGNNLMYFVLFCFCSLKYIQSNNQHCYYYYNVVSTGTCIVWAYIGEMGINTALVQ